MTKVHKKTTVKAFQSTTMRKQNRSSVSAFSHKVKDKVKISPKPEIISEGVTTIIVPEDRSGQRIDNFLLNKLKKIPKSRIYKILRSGEVRVNKKRCKPDYRIQENDSIRLPPLWQEGSLKLAPSISSTNFLQTRIIYEDNKLLILNKPSGMASHGGSGINFGVIETMRALRPNETLELVHRLDKGTSGCLIIAKKHSALRQLHALIREGKISKKYLLLVKGQWKNGTKTVNLPLLKNQLSSGERFVEVNTQGKASSTRFTPKKVFSSTSLLEAELYSGKTHQIRVHAAHLGYPIAGDDKYGDFEFNKIMKKQGLKRLFLHAVEVKFKLSDNEETIRVTASLDDELALFLEQLN